MQVFDADVFAEWLITAYRQSPFKSYAAVADKAGLSRSTVSAYAGAKKQPLTNKPSQPKVETVIALAKALNKEPNEALLNAGHAPINGIRPIPYKKTLDALARSGTLSDKDDAFLAGLIEQMEKRNLEEGNQ